MGKREPEVGTSEQMSSPRAAEEPDRATGVETTQEAIEDEAPTSTSKDSCIKDAHHAQNRDSFHLLRRTFNEQLEE